MMLKFYKITNCFLFRARVQLFLNTKKPTHTNFLNVESSKKKILIFEEKRENTGKKNNVSNFKQEQEFEFVLNHTL